MPVKTRNSSGRFESSTDSATKEEKYTEETVMSIPMKKNTLVNLIRILIVSLLLSPWLFMVFKKNNIENVSKKISEFYDDNFSCNTQCVCDLREDLKGESKSTDFQSKTDKNLSSNDSVARLIALCSSSIGKPITARMPTCGSAVSKCIVLPSMR